MSDQESELRYALRNLRHLYEQMLVPGRVTHTAEAANGLLAPAIRRIEQYEERMSRESAR